MTWEPRTPTGGWGGEAVRPAAEDATVFPHLPGVSPFQVRALKWFVGLWVFFLPVQVSVKGFLIPRFAPSDVVLVVFLFYLLVTRMAYDRRLWPISLTFLILAHLLANVVFTVTFGEISRWAVMNRTVGLLVLVLSFRMVTQYASLGWRNIQALVRLFIRVATAHALAAMVIMGLGLNDTFHANYMNARLSGFLLDPSAFGGLLVCAFVLAMVVYFRKGALYRPIEGMFSASILAVGAFLTYSRSCWVALLAGLVFTLFTRSVRHIAATTVVLSVVMAVAYLTVPIALENTFGEEAWEMSAQLATRGNTIESRMTYNREALSLFLESPVWGKGLGYTTMGSGRHFIHNTYLWMLAEFGAIGLAVLLWFLFTFFSRGRYAATRGRGQQMPVTTGLLAAFVAMAGLALGVEALNQRHWWFVMALMSAAYVLARRDERQAGRNTS